MRAVVDVAVATATAVATMAIGLLVVPVYLRVLGVEAYGLVGFLALLQSLLQLLDLGLVPTISREVASAGTRGSYTSVRPLFTALARLYLGVGLVLGAFIIVSAPYIATHWLNPKALSGSVVRNVVMLIGVIIACRWPAGIFGGALIGGHRLSLVSAINLIASMTSSLGGVAIILARPSIDLLFMWQAIVALCQLLAIRACAWRLIGQGNGATDMLGALQRVWRFSAGMGAITLIAVMLSQLDRLILSRLISLEAFGLYTLASVVGRTLYSLITPMYNVIAPRFTVMYEMGRLDTLAWSYRRWTTLFCATFFPATMAVAVASRPLIMIWTGDAAIAAQAAPIAALIAVGSGLHSVMYFPFALQIAAGDSRTPFLINLLLLAIYVPVLTALTGTNGALGAAIAWLTLFTIYVPVGTWLTHRRLLPGMAKPWLLGDIGIPLTSTGVIGALAWSMIDTMAGGTWIALAVTGAACFAAVLINFGIALVRFDDLRLFAAARLRRIASSLKGA